MQSNALVYLGVLGILALMSHWLLATVQSALHQDDRTLRQGPVMYIDNFLATHMNGQGIRHYTLKAPHLVQLPQQQGTQVRHPEISVFEGGYSREWLIYAEQGWMSADNQLIELQKQVRLKRSASSGKQPVVITTRNVSVHPDKDYLETGEAVHAKTPTTVLRGVGLKAYLDQDKIELLSNVRGSYAPPRR